MLAILGAGQRWLNRQTPALPYLSEAAYPFNILHMPLMTLVTYFVVQLDTTVAVKYPLIVLVTALLTLAVYDLVVKRLGALRFLLGMKAIPRAARPAEPLRQPAG